MAILVISYSRIDQPQVRAVVKLLQSALGTIEKTVFWDDDFEPGEPWFQQISESIDSAQQLFVFWCSHSASSEQVKREFLYAIGKNKRVVPVLLDSTPLANELKEIAGIDLRTMFRHGKRRVRVLLVSVLIAFLGVPAATAVFSDWPLPLAQFAFMDDHLPVPPPLPPPPIGGASWPSSLHVPVPVLPPPVGVPPTVGSVPRPEAPPEPLPSPVPKPVPVPLPPVHVPPTVGSVPRPEPPPERLPSPMTVPLPLVLLLTGISILSAAAGVVYMQRQRLETLVATQFEPYL